MGTHGNTALTFWDLRRGSPFEFRDTVILSSQKGFGSTDVTVETGLSRSFDADDVVIRGHLLALNLSDSAIEIETRDGGHVERQALSPDTIFVRRAGTQLRQRNHGSLYWAAVELPASTADLLLGGTVTIEPACGLVDEPLAHLMRAMVTEATTGCETGALYADTLTGALAARLAYRLGTSLRAEPSGALDAARLARVRELVEASLGTNLTVADLATAAGLSVAHFAREFRRATGQTPHAFVMSQRLERARRLLVVGRRPAEVAAATGFADQAHLSRAFRARFGVPPGKFRTTYRSAASFKVARSDVQDGKGDDGEPRG